MKFSVLLPVERIEDNGEFLGQDALRELVSAAEEAGFDACSVTDHPAPTGRWLDAGGHHAQDPFVVLAMAGMASRRIRLQTGVLVAPYRNPFLVARTVATLDVLTGGRVILGVGAGYLKAEFLALGVPFEERNRLTDEYLQAMIAAWTRPEFSFEGTDYRAVGNRILPRPVQTPYPPIWVGGNSQRAIRRAVRFGDGWCPFNATPLMAATTRTRPLLDLDDLDRQIAYLRGQMERSGRSRSMDIICGFVASRPGMTAGEVVEGLHGLAGRGITWATTGFVTKSRGEWCNRVRQYGAEVIAAVRRG